MFDVLFEVLFVFVSHNIVGATFGAMWVSFWSSFLVQKTYPNQELILYLFCTCSEAVVGSILAQIWIHVGVLSERFSIASTVPLMDRNDKNTKKNVLVVSEVPEKQRKPSRGGAAPGLAIRIPNAFEWIDF